MNEEEEGCRGCLAGGCLVPVLGLQEKGERSLSWLALLLLFAPTAAP